MMGSMKKVKNKSLQRRVDYHKLRGQLQTGDLVLFAGTSFSSRLVQLMTMSRWSHIGVVVKLPEYGNIPLLWEATRANKLADIQHGLLGDGVQLVSLDEKIHSYQGDVAIRRLKNSVDAQQRQIHLRKLMQDWQAKPYCNIVIKNLTAWWRGEKASTITQCGGFCSEFVAELYKTWQLLPPERPSRYYLPDDFAPNSSLKLAQGQLSSAWLLAI
jgi:hypothetical protein